MFVITENIMKLPVEESARYMVWSSVPTFAQGDRGKLREKEISG